MTVYRLLWIFLIFGAAGTEEVRPALIKSLLDIFNNASNVALFPELMETETCRRDCEIYRQLLLNNEMWAAEMYDANGKFSSGVLKGNLNQVGNLQECINAHSDSISGKFCYANIHVRPKENHKFVEDVWNRIWIPKFIESRPYENLDILFLNGFNWGLCVPSTCSSSELTKALIQILSPLNQSEFDLIVNINDIREWNCAIKDENDKPDYVKKLFLGLFIFACIATLIDAIFLEDNENISKNLFVALIKSYSMKFNWNSVFNVTESEEKISWINGLMCGAQFILYLAHFMMRLLMNNLVDKSEWLEFIFNNFAFYTFTRNAFFLIDLIIFLQGICHSYRLAQHLMKKKYGKIFQLCLYKYIKFLIFMMLIMAAKQSNIFNYKNEFGLKMNAYTNDFSLWKVIFCAENLLGGLKMGFGPAYLLYINTQLYILGAIVLILCGQRKNAMKYFIILIILAIIYRGIIIYVSNEAPNIMIPISIKQLIEMFDLVHNSALMNSVFYLSGVTIGYYIAADKKHFSDINPICRRAGWVVAVFLGLYALFCITFIHTSSKYTRLEGAIVILEQTGSWILFLMWTTWYCHIFQNSILSRFLSAKTFIILNRISGLFSIVHLIVLFNFAYHNKGGVENFQLTELGLNYYIVSILFCYFVVFAVQLPAKNMMKYFNSKYNKSEKND